MGLFSQVIIVITDCLLTVCDNFIRLIFNNILSLSTTIIGESDGTSAFYDLAFCDCYLQNLTVKNTKSLDIKDCILTGTPTIENVILPRINGSPGMTQSTKLILRYDENENKPSGLTYVEARLNNLLSSGFELETLNTTDPNKVVCATQNGFCFFVFA